MKTILFLAYRFIIKTREKTMRTMLIVTFLSIAAGSFTLAFVTAIMNGFEKEIGQTIQGVHPDLIIKTDEDFDYQKIQTTLSNEFGSCIKSVSPYIFQNAMIKTPEFNEISGLILLTGIDPISEKNTTLIHKIIKSPADEKFENLFLNEKVIIGQNLANKLVKKIGEKIVILIPKLTLSNQKNIPKSNQNSSQNQNSTNITVKKNKTNNNISSNKNSLQNTNLTNLSTKDNIKTNIFFEQHIVTIGGIFKTGMNDIDSQTVFCDLNLIKKLYPDANISQVGIKLTNPKFETQIAEKIQNKFSLDVISWKDLYPALLSALKLEKYSMALILALIILVASMNILALLFMFITMKKTEIALLKTFGLTNKNIRSLFIILGVGISLVASFVGLFGATIASHILTRYRLIKLPEIYYVSYLPAKMNLSIILAVIILVFFVSLIASIISTKYISKLQPASILKNIS